MVEIWLTLSGSLITPALISLYIRHRRDKRKEANDKVRDDESFARWYNENRDNIKN